MPNLTVSVDEDLMREVKAHPGINWSHVAREGIRRKLSELHIWDGLLKDSTMTDEDAIVIGDDIKRSIAKRLGLMD